LWIALGSALAQDRGTIEGTVTDPTGAAIPAATVRVVQVGTNATWTLTANEVGRYYAPNLPLGTYTVSVQQAGFATATSASVEIRSQSNVRVDLQLQVGVVSENVQVSAQAALLDTATATVSSSVTTKQLDELPLISFGQKADITSFLQYLPGSENQSANSSMTPIMDGSQAFITEVFVDGAPASDGVFRGSLWENGAAVSHYGEFNIVANSFSAEYGRAGTWFYSVTTKSGSNDLHGSVYDYFVNTTLNARDFFQATRQIYHQNNGGYTLGGPVYIPKIYDGRNKTFFFFGHDLFYSVGAQSGTLLTIPTLAMRQGDFSNYVNGAGQQIPIFDPSSATGLGVRTQFPNNIIPANQISNVSKNIMALMPVPDLPTGTSNWHNRTGANPLFNNFTETVRLDHSFSDKEKFFISYGDEYRPRKIAGVGWGADSPLEGLQDQPLHSRTVRFAVDSIIRPSLINHVTLGYDYYLNPAFSNTAGQGWDTQLGLNGLPFDIGSFPSVSFSGGTNPPLNMGSAQWSHLGTSRWALNESLTWIKGHHFLKFGGSYWYEVRNDRAQATASGTWAFANTITSQPSATQAAQWGSAFASFLLGAVGTATTHGPTFQATRLPYQALFIQDEWHVLPKLSLSLGLRWENNSPTYDKYDRFANFNPSAPNPAAGNIPGALVFSGNGPGTINARTTVEPWHKGFSPRFGYVYEFSPKLVMRGSFGIFYPPPVMNALSLQWYQNQGTFQSPDNYTPAYFWDQRFPTYPIDNGLNPSYSNGQVVHWYAPDFVRSGPIINWTAGFQYQLSQNMLLDITYIGRHATSQQADYQGNPNVLNPAYLSLGTLLSQNINSAAAAAAGIKAPWSTFSSFALPTVGQALRPFPQYSDVYNMRSKLGIDRYNSLQIKVNRRFSGGLTLMSSFTWSKNLTNVPTSSPAPTGQSPAGIQSPYERLQDISPSEYTLPADFKVSLAYDLPFGTGRHFLRNSHSALNAVVGGWQIVFFIERASGNALTLTTTNNLAIYGYGTKRANVRSGVPLTLNTDYGSFEPATDRFINPAAFSSPGTYELGNTPRTIDWMRGWPFRTESASIKKMFRLHEKATLRLAGDFQNPFNVVRWGNPVTNVAASNFGQVTTTAPGRRVQITAEIQF